MRQAGALELSGFEVSAQLIQKTDQDSFCASFCRHKPAIPVLPAKFGTETRSMVLNHHGSSNGELAPNGQGTFVQTCLARGVSSIDVTWVCFGQKVGLVPDSFVRKSGPPFTSL